MYFSFIFLPTFFQNLVNVYLTPEKIGNSNGMQITYEKDGIRRNLYVFGNDGKSTIGMFIKTKYIFFKQMRVTVYNGTIKISKLMLFFISFR